MCRKTGQVLGILCLFNMLNTLLADTVEAPSKPGDKLSIDEEADSLLFDVQTEKVTTQNPGNDR